MARYRHYHNYDAFPRYVSVAEKQTRNQRAVTRLRKKNPDIQPVVVEGRRIATSWWGKSWNANLERYADYSNRIGRGRSYVCHGAVLDLQLEPGAVRALVQGSSGNPYKVQVTIERLSATVWNRLRDVALTQLESLTDLIAGKFPAALKDAFFAQGAGLFPAPKEIGFDCSCPDWASMCKHVAATLYGVGNRLDAAPELLFTLRGVTVDDLIARTVEATAEGLIGKAEQAAGDGVLSDADLSDVFGIELDATDVGGIERPTPAVDSGKAKKRTRAVAGKKKPVAATASAKPAVRRRKAAHPSPPRRPAGRAEAKAARQDKRRAKGSKPEPGRMLEQLIAALGRSRARLTTADVAAKLPAWTRLQVTNTLQRAVGRGLVERVARGVYRRA